MNPDLVNERDALARELEMWGKPFPGVEAHSRKTFLADQEAQAAPADKSDQAAETGYEI